MEQDYEQQLEALQAHIYHAKGNLADPEDIAAIVQLERRIASAKAEAAQMEPHPAITEAA